MRKNKDLILGTSMWGWTVEKKECFKILDTFYNQGYRWIDSAPNYPINNDSKYFRYAENIIAEWINSNKINDLRIISKIGSLNNMGSPNNNLSFSFILMNFEYYLEKFRSCLNIIMIHWDNRDSLSTVESTVNALKLIKQNGVDIGLSGIKKPKHYFNLKKKLSLDFIIELKHNIFSSSYKHYSMFHNDSKFIVYGINASGIKINDKYKKSSSLIVRRKDYRSKKYNVIINRINKLIENYKEHTSFPVKSFNHIGMIYAFNSLWVSGIIIGPSSLIQLTDSISFFNNLNNCDTKNIYDEIRNSII